MSSFPNYLSVGCLFLILVGSAVIDAAPAGFVEEYLKIVSLKEVELVDASPSKGTAQNYAEYAL